MNQIAEVPLILLRLFGFAVLAIVVGVPVGAIMMKRRGERRLQAVVANALANTPAEGPVVHLRFHTYHGFIIFVVQTTHDLKLPISQARRLLDRLQRFNRTWGLFAYGFLVIPILSHFEYRSQLRSIEQQAMGGFPVDGKASE